MAAECRLEFRADERPGPDPRLLEEGRAADLRKRGRAGGFPDAEAPAGVREGGSGVGRGRLDRLPSREAPTPLLRLHSGRSGWISHRGGEPTEFRDDVATLCQGWVGGGYIMSTRSGGKGRAPRGSRPATIEEVRARVGNFPYMQFRQAE